MLSRTVLARVARSSAAASVRRANVAAFSTARLQPSAVAKPALTKLQQAKATRNYATEAVQTGNIKQVIGAFF